MISFHPKFTDLQTFSAGNCEPAKALMISAHVDMCPKCQHDCIDIQNEMAGELIAQPASSLSMDSQYYAMMSNITELPVAVSRPPEASSTSIELDGKFFELPRTLRRHVRNTGNWSRLVGKLWQAPVDLGDIGKANFMYMENGPYIFRIERRRQTGFLKTIPHTKVR